MLIQNKKAWLTLLMLLLTNNICLPMDYANTQWFLDSSPCLVVLARYEIDTPIANAPTTTNASSSASSNQTTGSPKEKHFFLLMQFQDPKKKFGVESTELKNPISALTNMLFPDQSNQKIFVFDSKRLTDYINLIQNLPDNNRLVQWWLSTQSLFKTGANWGKEISKDTEVKMKLKQSIYNFNTKIDALTNMQFITDTKQPLIAIAETIPNSDNSKILAQKKDTIQKVLKQELFESNFLGLAGTLSKDETDALKKLMGRITTAHIAYVADLSSDKIIDALPRAIYKEVKVLCENLRVGAPTFKPRVFEMKTWKKGAMYTTALASAGILGSLAAYIGIKYNIGNK